MNLHQLILVLTALSLGGCSNLASLRIAQSPGGSGHAVTGDCRNFHCEFRSLSVYTTRGDGVTQNINFVQLSTGAADQWRWHINIARVLIPSWKAYLSDRKTDQLRGAGELSSWPVRLPGPGSWRAAIETLKEVSSFVAGKPTLPLHVLLYLVPTNLTLEKSITSTSRRAIPLSFYFSFPLSTSRDPHVEDRRLDSLLTMMVALGHEYFHALARIGEVGPFPNMATEEAAAYTFQHCLSLALTGDQGYLNVPSGTDIRAGVVDPDSVSNEGAYLANKNILHLVGQGKIKGTNYKSKNELFSLCRGMAQRPFDLTKGLYPTADLVPAQYFSSRSKN